MADPFEQEYFFTTDDLQECDDRFVSVATVMSIEEVRYEKYDYTEIPNPDPAMTPQEIKGE